MASAAEPTKEAKGHPSVRQGRAASSQNKHRVQVHKSLSALEQCWTELETRTPGVTVFQTLAWCQAWCNAAEEAGQAQNLRILAIYEEERLVLLWPLAIRRIGMCRIVHALAEPATQYCDALVEPKADRVQLLQLAWATILSWRDVDLIELRRVREDAALMKLPHLGHLGELLSQESAPFFDFQNESATGPVAGRSSRTRNALQRHLNNLGRHGPVEFEAVDCPVRKSHLIDEALQLKAQWIEQKAVYSSGYSHAANDPFVRSIARNPDFLIARLSVGGETAAIEAGVVRNGRYWSLIQSYDARFAAHSPGRLLLTHFFAWCPRAGIRFIDFLAPAHRHKREWANGQTVIRDYVVPRTIRGRVAVLMLRHIKPALKTMYQSLPPALRQFQRHRISR